MDKNQTKISGRGRENSETEFPCQGFVFFSKFSHKFFFFKLKKKKLWGKYKLGFFYQIKIKHWLQAQREVLLLQNLATIFFFKLKKKNCGLNYKLGIFYLLKIELKLLAQREILLLRYLATKFFFQT